MQPLRLLFDLDGTLMDTAPDLHATLNHCLITAGRPTVTLNSVKHMVGQGARVLLERGLTGTGGLPSPSEFEELVVLFFEYYADHLSEHSVIYEGLIPVLDALVTSKCSLGICTNKPEKFAKSIITDFNLDQYFPVITGGDSFDIRKPHPDHILKTVDLLPLKSGKTVMIGDTHNDIDAANAAKITSIAVSFGYSDVPARQLGATHTIDHFNELLPLLIEIF